MVLNLIDEALNLLRAGVRIVSEIGDVRERATHLRLIAEAFEDLGFRDEAREILLEASRIAMKIEDVEERIEELKIIANQLRFSGFLEDSIEILEEGIRSLEKEEDPRMKLEGYVQIVDELMDAKALDVARELIYKITQILLALRDAEVENPDILIDAFKMIVVFEKGEALKEILSIILYKIEEIENEEIRNDLLLDLTSILMRIGWLDEAKEIILNRITSPELKIEGIIKFSDYVTSHIEKLREFTFEYEIEE